MSHFIVSLLKQRRRCDFCIDPTLRGDEEDEGEEGEVGGIDRLWQ